MNKSQWNRRSIIKHSFFGTAALAAVGFVGCTGNSSDEKAPMKEDTGAAGTKDGGKKLEYVSQDNSMAKSLSYSPDATKVDSSLRVDKGKTAASEQFCNNCQFYTPVDSTNGEGGKCTLFPGKLVKSEGWCKSWQLKANA